MEVVFFALQSFKKWINSLPLLPQFYCTREIWHRRSNWKKVFNPNTKNDLTTRKTGWSKPGCSSKSLLMKRFQIPQGPNRSLPITPAPHKAWTKKAMKSINKNAELRHLHHVTFGGSCVSSNPNLARLMCRRKNEKHLHGFFKLQSC